MPNEENINYPYEDPEDNCLDVICPHCSYFMVVDKTDEFIRCVNCQTIHHKGDLKILSEQELLSNNMFNAMINEFNE